MKQKAAFQLRFAHKKNVYYESLKNPDDIMKCRRGERRNIPFLRSKIAKDPTKPVKKPHHFDREHRQPDGAYKEGYHKQD